MSGADLQDSELIILTGMSGAGRTTAARALEDLGWFVIDNIPPTLLLEALELASGSSDIKKVAVVSGYAEPLTFRATKFGDV